MASAPRTGLVGLALLVGGAAAPSPAPAFEMTEEGVRLAAERLFAAHGYADVDPGVVDEVVRLVRKEESYLFGKVASLTTDPEFLPFLERYEALKRRRVGEGLRPDVRVVFGRAEPGSAGYCFHLTRTVFIDVDWWRYMRGRDRFKEGLVFHELGHCDLGRGHDSFFSGMSGEDSYFSFMDIDLTRALFGGEDFRPEDPGAMGALLDGRFGGDPGAAFASMEEELFSRRGTQGRLSDRVCETGTEECYRHVYSAEQVPARIRERTVPLLECLLGARDCDWPGATVVVRDRAELLERFAPGGR